MVPVKALFQGLKKVIQSGGNAYDAKQGAILRLPLAGGRWVHSFTIHGGLPLLPLLSSSRSIFPQKISQLEGEVT
jgi:hypothetical protein